jgi:hypothetical protein
MEAVTYIRNYLRLGDLVKDWFFSMIMVKIGMPAGPFGIYDHHGGIPFPCVTTGERLWRLQMDIVIGGTGGTNVQ